MVQKIACSNPGLGQLATEELSLSTQQQMDTFFESGNDKAAKEKGRKLYAVAKINRIYHRSLMLTEKSQP